MTFNLINWLNQQSGGPQLPLTLSHFDEKSDAAAADRREWLVTNGLGSYASGSITGANTRRYHGLFVASLTPPVRRTVLLSRLDETITVSGGSAVELSTNHWHSGIIAPRGYSLVEAFSDLPVPTWCYRFAGGRLIKQILMQAREQRVYLGYTWLPDDGSSSADLKLAAAVNYRDFHGETRGSDNWTFAQEQTAAEANSGLTVKLTAFAGAQPFYIQTACSYKPFTDWYRGYQWPREYERGLGDTEDCFHAGNFHVTLRAGQSLTVACGMEALDVVPDLGQLVKSVSAHKAALIEKAGAGAKSDTIKRLVLAADQFVARRESTDGSTIIAGYHWFSDWGRDSMISLPGLCLSSGRPEEGKSILATFGKYLSQGMLPNFFPDGGQVPEYNTADATLWWAQALHHYFKATGDKDFVKTQLPLLQEVVDWHVKGTRHGLHLDTDGLVTGGDAHVQLTWMDAKCGDFVVTPRSGKAVEISALWYNFVLTLQQLRKDCGLVDAGTSDSNANSSADASLTDFATRAKAGFEKFWDEKRGYLADVLHDDGSLDEAIRPNQLLACSLTFPIVSVERAKRIVDVVEAKLLTPMGLRTLSPDHPDYNGLFGLGKAWANQYDRDITYHQGTVWPWLLGPWVNARLYAYGETEENFAFIAAHLKQILAHIEADACVGSVSEIFDGDAPHKAQGCVAQAWSVAELLRVLSEHPQLAGA